MRKMIVTIGIILLIALALLVSFGAWSVFYSPSVDVQVDVQNVNHNEAFDTIKNLKLTHSEWFGSSGIFNKSNLKWQLDDNGNEIIFGNASYLYAKNVKTELEDDFFIVIDRYFNYNKFETNKLNTGVHDSDSDFINSKTRFFAYEKGSQKCKLNFIYTKDRIPENSYNIVCANYSKGFELKYIELQKIYKPGYFSIRKFTNIFALGDKWSDGPGGGLWWMAKKIDGQWTEIIKSQEDPFCLVLEKYQVPDSFYVGRCWEDDGSTQREWVNS